MIANRMTPVLAAVALVAAFATLAEARDRWHDGGQRHHRVENGRWDRHGDGRRNRPFNPQRPGDSYGGSISIVRGLGTFSGATEAYRVRGNGIYFSRDYWPAQEKTTVVLAPKARIIHVDEDLRGQVGSACSYEAGVCVIRGGIRGVEPDPTR